MPDMQDSEIQLIEAYVDNQLDGRDKTYIAHKISTDVEYRTYYAKLVIQKKLLIDWWNNKKQH